MAHNAPVMVLDKFKVYERLLALCGGVDRNLLKYPKVLNEIPEEKWTIVNRYWELAWTGGLFAQPDGTEREKEFLLQNVIGGAAGPSQIPESAEAAGEADVRATIKKRAPCSAKYAVHLTVPAPEPYKEAATVVGPHHVATYAHEGHLSWQCEQTIPVAVHCPDEDRRTHVDATVVYHDKEKDVAILEVQRELAPPVLDTAISAGDMYYIHGQSTQAQADDTSISHGMVAATELDKLSHIRGDIISGTGDSGGGCFSVATGKLMAMVVGSDETTKKAILVPIAVISSILTDLAAQRRLREQHPGCAA